MSTKPAIILAKEKITETPTQNTPTKINIAEFWNRKAGGIENNKTKMLLQRNLKDLGGGLSEADPDLSQLVGLSDFAIRKAREGSAGKSIVSGAERIAFSPKLAMNKAVNEMFVVADRLGLKSPQQFQASFDELLKASPTAKTHFSDAAVMRNYPNIKEVAGKLYGDLIQERDSMK